MDNFQFFGLNLGKSPNYVQYFGPSIVEGVAESWVDTEMSLVEVDGAGWSCVEVDGARWRWLHGLVIPDQNFMFNKCSTKFDVQQFDDPFHEVINSLSK